MYFKISVFAGCKNYIEGKEEDSPVRGWEPPHHRFLDYSLQVLLYSTKVFTCPQWPETFCHLQRNEVNTPQNAALFKNQLQHG